MNRKKILLGHLNSNGDCLYATVIARQIKEVDYPDCHLTWAVNNRCAQTVRLNPYVDEIWEVPTEKTLTTEEEWFAFAAEVDKKRKNGEFDAIFYTQIIGENRFNYDGGIRSSTYNNYPNKITVSHTPIIRLSDEEVENVRRFAQKHNLEKLEQVILVECGPDSFDAALNFETAYELALALTAKSPNVAVILSSNKPVPELHSRIIDGSKLSFRENAELTKYCSLFIGCGSGISWLATTDWAKKLNKVLIVPTDTAAFPSMIYDHQFIGLPTNHIIEIKSGQTAMKKLKSCLAKISIDGFESARNVFNEKIRLSNYLVLQHQLEITLSKFDFGKAFSCLQRHIKRNGIQFVFNKQTIKIIWRLQRLTVNKLLKAARLKPKTSQPT